jgi:hypothetical protein
MLLIREKSDGWCAVGWIILFLGASWVAFAFLKSFALVLGFFFLAALLYWPIRLILESSVSLVLRLMRK